MSYAFRLSGTNGYLHSFPTRRSSDLNFCRRGIEELNCHASDSGRAQADSVLPAGLGTHVRLRSEEHTSELQSRGHLVCRLLLEKKNTLSPQNPSCCPPISMASISSA